MITLFTSTKPFQDAVEITQRNTVACWRRLEPACEVLLIGEEKGSAAVAKEFGARLIPEVERNEFGTPLLRSIFSVAEANASFPILLYANADILFTNRLIRAAHALADWRKPYLMFGRRWDTDLHEPFDFNIPDWENRLEGFARAHGKPAIKSALDYFMFPKGAWGGQQGIAEFPPIVIGRPPWDNWIVFWALAGKMDAINSSDFIFAIHQNHNYGHYAGGQKGVYAGEEAKRNFALASYERFLYSTPDATHRIRPDGKIVRAFSADILRRRLKTFPDLLRVWIFGRKRWKPS
jgi:hypothetical protein